MKYNMSQVCKIVPNSKIFDVIGIVSNHMNLTVTEILDNLKTRKGNYVSVRYISMYFLRKYTDMSLSEIGKIFEKDHASVVHANKAINNLLDTDKYFKKEFEIIEEKVKDIFYIEEKIKVEVVDVVKDIDYLVLQSEINILNTTIEEQKEVINSLKNEIEILKSELNENSNYNQLKRKVDEYHKIPCYFSGETAINLMNKKY